MKKEVKITKYDIHIMVLQTHMQPYICILENFKGELVLPLLCTQEKLDV